MSTYRILVRHDNKKWWPIENNGSTDCVQIESRATQLSIQTRSIYAIEIAGNPLDPKPIMLFCDGCKYEPVGDNETRGGS